MDRSPLARKDPAVRELVDRFAADLGAESFDLVDHWEDLMAIGLARPSDHDVLVYVAIAINDEGDVLESEDRYYYECETPSDADELGYTVARSGDHVSYEEMLRAAAAHLRTQQA
ncbi:hypothetical protein AB0L00_19315 [Actinoallomurus sp. NPDC052308]|uniref:hypothetical protein n=1 Tax=Actinoallomurus sp. NPDC052308 TaxID=3155530 RepID=UPI003442563E